VLDYVARKEGLVAGEAEALLNKQSGCSASRG
jgi:hypothetical protein